MRVINTELLRPANLLAIAIVVILTQWVVHHMFAKHVVDERKRARFSKSRGNGGESGDENAGE